MKTKQFNWRKRLDELIKSNFRDPHDYEQLVALARTWPTCACGELCKSLPRNLDGAPVDLILAGMGLRFYHDIVGCDWVTARNRFLAIEKRVGELLERRDDSDAQHKQISL
jgi:hypothetical protein